MTNKLHTPGPWETGEVSWNEDGDVRYTLHGIKTANVSDCRLISAAPDLLDALLCARAVLRTILAGDLIESEIIADEISRIDMAIAKARGESGQPICQPLPDLIQELGSGEQQ